MSIACCPIAGGIGRQFPRMGDGLREGCGVEPCLALAVLLVPMVVVERSDAGEAADVLCIICVWN
jgi:hypothetical protein